MWQSIKIILVKYDFYSPFLKEKRSPGRWGKIRDNQNRFGEK